MLDPTLIKRIENIMNLIEWLKIVDSKIGHGKIVINYHQGKITCAGAFSDRL